MANRPARSTRARASSLTVGCWLLAVGCVLPLLGCNAGKQTQHDLYSRELRLQEDEIYRLEDCLEEYQAIVQGMRKENAELRSQLGGDAPVTRAEPLPPGPISSDGESDDRSLLDSFDWSPDRPTTPPAAPAPTPPSLPADDGDVPGIELPAIDGGEPTDAPPFVPSSSEAGPLSDSPTGGAPTGGVFDAPPIELPPPATPGASPPAPQPRTPQPLDTQPLESNPLEELLPLPAGEPLGLLPTGNESSSDGLTAEAQLAAATNSDAPRIDLLGAPTRVVAATLSAKSGPLEPTGEATVVASVQPRSADGRVTLFQGEAALLVRDPAKPRKESVLGRWQFTAPEVASAWTDLADEPRFLLPLVLPDGLVESEKHELWVRLTDSDGNRVLAKTPLPIPVKVDSIEESPAPLAPPIDAKPLATVNDNSEPPTNNGWKRKSSAVLRAAYVESSSGSAGAETQTSYESELRVTSLDAEPLATPAAGSGNGWSRRRSQ